MADEKIPAWAEQLIAKTNELYKKLEKSDVNEVHKARIEIAKQRLEGIPEHITKGVIRDIPRMRFTDEQDFETFLQEMKSDSRATAKQKEATREDVDTVLENIMPSGTKPKEKESKNPTNDSIIDEVLNNLM